MQGVPDGDRVLDLSVRARRGGFRLDVALRASHETVAVVGPNGAGKSTLLRCVAGLTAVQRGCIRLGGRTLLDTRTGVNVPTEARRFGVVFQDYLLFPHRTALDNVAFGVRARGAGRAAARQVARTWLDRVGLADRAGARPGALSGGEAQRVALARALATEPDALLLDEPLAALDVAARHRIRTDLRRHLADFAGPVLLVTHDPVEAATLADRLVVVEDGRITQQGTVADITRHPRSRWVARLAGVNLYRGQLAGHVVRLRDGGDVHVAEPGEGEVFATFAPSAVALYRTRPDGTPRNVWQAHVDGYDTRGDRVRVHLRGPPDVTAEITPAAAAGLDLAGGGALHVAVKATEIRTYPA